MAQIELHEAATTLSRLVDRAQAGEEIILARDGVPVVRLVPLGRKGSMADVHGVLHGRIEFAPDFDDFPDDVGHAFGVS